jgi:DeoR family fructose operon transcriptional repressor
MYAPERHRAILDTARDAGRVEVKSLARQFDVTPETIRRDLTALESRGLLLRAHGGAIPIERSTIEATVEEREHKNVDEKDRIARLALSELTANMSIILDSGTTTIRLAQLLPADLNLTVVTNSMTIAAVLAGKPGINLHVLGGHVRENTLAAVGPWAWDALAGLTVDVAFIGANGVTAERGLTTPDVDEARVKSAFVEKSRRTIALADHSKFGREDFAVVAPIHDVDAIITDTRIDAETVSEISALGIEVRLA